MPELIPETWADAQARKIAERAQLEAERSEIGVRVNALQTRKSELSAAITIGNRRREPVADARADLARVEVDLADTRAQYAGVEADLQLIHLDPTDGLGALLEVHRPELVDIARRRSEQATQLLAEMRDAFTRFHVAFEQARHAASEAFATGRPDGGHRREELGDARLPGSSALDAVAVDLGEKAFHGARVATPGLTWLRPFDTLDKILSELDGYSCLPAAAITDPRQGQEGRYRRVTDGQRILVDKLALRRQCGPAVAGEDGFAALRYEGPLTEGDRQALENNRAEQEDWAAGRPNLNPIGADDAPLAEPAPDAGDGLVWLDQRAAQTESEVSSDDKLRELGIDWQPQAGRRVI